MPGTGKTATVRQVVSECHKDPTLQLQPFHYVELNCMKLPDPHHVYLILWQHIIQLYGRLPALNFARKRGGAFKAVGTPATAAAGLERFFRSGAAKRGRGGEGAHHDDRLGARPMLVLVLDEMDFLLTKNQSVLYNLLHWPMGSGARMIVMGISNTLDLSDRLIPRVRSRLGLGRVSFAPYTRQQLQVILTARLQQVGFRTQAETETAAAPAAAAAAAASAAAAGPTLVGHLFHPDAIELCARKVAALSGDARRALQICRRAVELAESSAAEGPAASEAAPAPEVVVDMRHIDRAVKELFASPMTPFIQAASMHEKLVIVSLLLETRLRNLTDIPVDNVMDRYAPTQNKILFPLPAACLLPPVFFRPLILLLCKLHTPSSALDFGIFFLSDC